MELHTVGMHQRGDTTQQKRRIVKSKATGSCQKSCQRPQGAVEGDTIMVKLRTSSGDNPAHSSTLQGQGWVEGDTKQDELVRLLGRGTLHSHGDG